jgi:hypothetical protein
MVKMLCQYRNTSLVPESTFNFVHVVDEARRVIIFSVYDLVDCYNSRFYLGDDDLDFPKKSELDLYSIWICNTTSNN